MRALTLCLPLTVAACGPSTPTVQEPGPQDAARLAALPAPYSAANLANGRAGFAPCRVCHTLASGAANRTGPNLHGVIGRNAAAQEGFQYSAAMKRSGLMWDPGRLDAFLADPRGVVPGTRMSFPGVRDAASRRDLIAYLMVEAGPAPSAAPATGRD